jgi:hypothetical protein
MSGCRRFCRFDLADASDAACAAENNPKSPRHSPSQSLSPDQEFHSGTPSRIDYANYLIVFAPKLQQQRKKTISPFTHFLIIIVISPIFAYIRKLIWLSVHQISSLDGLRTFLSFFPLFSSFLSCFTPKNLMDGPESADLAHSEPSRSDCVGLNPYNCLTNRPITAQYHQYCRKQAQTQGGDGRTGAGVLRARERGAGDFRLRRAIC